MIQWLPCAWLGTDKAGIAAIAFVEVYFLPILFLALVAIPRCFPHTVLLLEIPTDTANRVFGAMRSIPLVALPAGPARRERSWAVVPHIARTIAARVYLWKEQVAGFGTRLMVANQDKGGC